MGVLLLVALNVPSSVSQHTKAVLREGIAPIQGLITSFSLSLEETIKSIRGLGDLSVQNQKLSAEVIRMRNEVWQLKALEKENVELRKQLDYQQKTTRELIPCEVIGRDISGWWQTIRLGKGSSQGVSVPRAVVTSDGVVGKTMDVSPRTCDILLLSDPSCRVATQVSRTKTFGIVRGQGVSWNREVVLRMEFINKDSPIRLGDEVVTSGLGGVFPRGLLLGYVDEVVLDRSGLYQSATLIPTADLGGVTYAFVVTEEEDPIESLLRRRRFNRIQSP